jgi:hypothetical protein
MPSPTIRSNNECARVQTQDFSIFEKFFKEVIDSAVKAIISDLDILESEFKKLK